MSRRWRRGVRRRPRGFAGGRPELVIYAENAGDFTVPLSAVEAVHSEKVVLNCAKLDKRLRHAIGHAHEKEEPGA